MSTPIFDPAGLVNEGWNTFSGLAVNAFNVGINLVNDLGSFEVSPVNFDASFDVNNSLLSGFNTPTKPTDPNLNFNIQIPEPLEIELPDIPDFGAAPESTASPPSLDFSGQPDPLQIPEPPDPPVLDDIEVPDAPVLTLPEVPDLLELNLPEPPDIIEHEFLGEKPEIDFEAPDTFIDFTEEAYQSDQLDRVVVEIRRMLDDGIGMPAVVEQMLVDRARTREDREAQRAVHTATEEWGSRGFTLPSGVLARRVTEARQNNQNQHNTLSREVFIQRRTEERENFQFAIAQGIGLENILIQQHLNVMQRAFEFARAVVETKFRVFEAKVRLYNAAIQGYQVDAEVYRLLIQAESQKLEQFRLEIQAEALKSEINRNKIAIYTAQVEALESFVRIYVAQIEAARTLAEKNNAEVRAYVGQIEAFRARIDAKTAEFQTWATKVRGQLGKVQAYEAETRAFLADVQAYEVGTRAKALEPQLFVQIQESKVRQVIAQLEAVRTEIQSEGTRLQSEAQVFGSKAQMYAADGSIAANQADANTRQFQAAVEERRTESERALAEAQLNVEQVLRSATIIVQALEAAARTSAQLSAGAVSAVNLGASISGSDSYSTSQVTNISG